MMFLDDPDNPLAVEIRQEAAAAYFAACKKMVAALEALKAFERAAASVTTTGNEQITRRSELFEDAVERVHSVVIQREAMKLSGYESFFEHYGVPPEVRARLGSQPKRHGPF